jgi:hypothetical protein
MTYLEPAGVKCSQSLTIRSDPTRVWQAPFWQIGPLSEIGNIEAIGREPDRIVSKFLRRRSAEAACKLLKFLAVSLPALLGLLG